MNMMIILLFVQTILLAIFYKLTSIGVIQKFADVDKVCLAYSVIIRRLLCHFECI